MWFDVYKTHTFDFVKILMKSVACAHRAYGTENTLVIFPEANVSVEMLHQNSLTGFPTYIFQALAPPQIPLKQKGRYAVNVIGRFVWGAFLCVVRQDCLLCSKSALLMPLAEDYHLLATITFYLVALAIGSHS